jgi:glycosyltransferase involved in cell wall biosynthesis
LVWVVYQAATALVVPEGTAAAIERAIACFGDNRVAGVRLGAAARATVSERFGWTRTAERLEAAYDRALAFKSRSS